MSFVQHYCYTISAKQEILSCTDIDNEFAGLLLSEPVVYRNREFIGKAPISDQDHERFIKLLFLADMRSEYGSHFFGAEAPLAVEFFDEWWTLTKSDDPQDVQDVVARLHEADFQALASFSSDVVADRIRRDRNHGES